MEPSATVPVLAPAGDLDLATARDLGTRIAELAGNPGDAVLDLTGVSFMDSVGLGVVLKGLSRFGRQGKRLHVVVAPQSNVARLLELAGARERVDAVETREEARARATAGR